MREREVVKMIAERLKRENFQNIQVRYGQQHGPDIEAVLPSSHRTLYIEAKGETKNPELALGMALYQILSRYDDQSVCAIALPFTERYEQLVRKILTGVSRLGYIRQ